MIRLVVAGAITFSLSGCAAFMSRGMHWDSANCWMMFQGIAGDTEFISDTNEPEVVVGGIIDVPFSLAADIVLIPLDLYKLHKVSYDWCPPNRPQEAQQGAPADPPRPAGSAGG
jgi:uncharacterized protein YceK